MRQVTGFLTADGAFFESQADAELHECTIDLEKAAEEIGFSPNALLTACEKIPLNIMRFIHAHQAATTHEDTRTTQGDWLAERTEAVPDTRRVAEAYLRGDISEEQYFEYNRFHNQDDGRREEVATRQLKQPAHKRERVPDLRGRLGTASVQEQGKSNGVGGGRDHASGLRRSTPSTTRTPTEFAEARRREREAALSDELGEDMDERDEGGEAEGR